MHKAKQLTMKQVNVLTISVISYTATV